MKKNETTIALDWQLAFENRSVFLFGPKLKNSERLLFFVTRRFISVSVPLLEKKMLIISKIRFLKLLTLYFIEVTVKLRGK